MAKNRDKRLDDLEKSITPSSGDEIRVRVNWRDDDLVLDEASNEYVTPKEWRERHPNDRLIIVSCGDIEGNETQDRI